MHLVGLHVYFHLFKDSCSKVTVILIMTTVVKNETQTYYLQTTCRIYLMYYYYYAIHLCWSFVFSFKDPGFPMIY